MILDCLFSVCLSYHGNVNCFSRRVNQVPVTPLQPKVEVFNGYGIILSTPSWPRKYVSLLTLFYTGEYWSSENKGGNLELGFESDSMILKPIIILQYLSSIQKASL